MYATDFKFDGQLLSSFGFTCISWDGDPNASNIVSNIEFTTGRAMGRYTWDHYSAQFSEPLSATIQIGAFECPGGSLRELTPETLSPIMRWLNRRDGYKEFQLVSQVGYEDLYFYAQINVNPLKCRGRVYALELSIGTNRPFAVKKCSKDFTINTANETQTITDISDDIGDTPILMQVTSKGAGTLTIANDRLSAKEQTEIKSVVSGELFTLDGVNLIATDSAERTDAPLAKRFNYRFPKLVNTYENTENVFTFSLPCTVHAEWDSPVKVGL